MSAEIIPLRPKRSPAQEIAQAQADFVEADGRRRALVEDLAAALRMTTSELEAACLRLGAIVARQEALAVERHELRQRFGAIAHLNPPPIPFRGVVWMRDRRPLLQRFPFLRFLKAQ